MFPRFAIILPIFPGILTLATCLHELPRTDFFPLLFLGGKIEDTTPSVVGLSPDDGSTGLSILGVPFTVTFNRVMNPDSISVQSSSGACTGTIQVAGDGGLFSSCIGATLSSSDNVSFAVTPIVTSPGAGGTAQLKVLSTVQSAAGTTMVSDFQTSSGFTLFAPSDFSGLALWLQADKIDGLSDGNAITSNWSDNSGSGNNATPVASQEPLYRNTAGPNSQPWVEFISASSHQFILPEFINFTEPTIFLVVFGNDTTIFADQGAATQTLRINGVSGQFHLRIDDSAADYITSGAPKTYTASALASWSIGSFRISGNTIDVYANGVNMEATIPTDSNAAYDTTTVWNDGDQPRLGADTGGSSTWNGGIAEVLIFNRAVSDTERARIECYLSRKYSISGPSC